MENNCTFLTQAEEKFGEGFFDYSDMKYESCRTLIKIKCNKHNFCFEIFPLNHLAQFFGGCKLCKFVNTAKEKYGENLFDYSALNYKSDNVSIRCVKHNYLFEIATSDHLSRENGCLFCAGDIKLQENEQVENAAEPGYEHLYWVTNFGNVFTKGTYEKLTIRTHNNGSYFVSLSNENNKKKQVAIAILVYKTWKGNDDPEYDSSSKYVICKDGNKLNNHISNLECVPQGDVLKNAMKNSSTVRGYGIRILMFEKTDKKCTKVVKTFENMHKVCEFLERKSAQSSISRCMNGKRNSRTAYGYRWRWESPPLPKETVENIDGFACLGIIKGKDFKKYYISREGIVINKNANNEILKAHIGRSGYLEVGLSSKGKHKDFRIHRLIGRYFLDDGKSFYDDGFDINHIDENKLNNSVENLEWTTHQKNILHSLGIRVAKLDKNTLEILDIYESIKEAYEDVNRKYSTGITAVCRGSQKTSAGFKWKYLTPLAFKLIARLSRPS